MATNPLALNPHFTHGTADSESGLSPEQVLYEDFITEQISIFGQAGRYIPRTLVETDLIFNEDIASKFSAGFELPVYMENFNELGGQKEILQKFGLEQLEEAQFVISRRAWDLIYPQIQTANLRPKTDTSTRPNEGDLLWIPLLQKLFEITFVDTDAVNFFQINRPRHLPPIYALSCNLFTYSNEEFENTGVDEIDSIDETARTKNALDTVFETENEGGDGSADNLINDSESSPFGDW